MDRVIRQLCELIPIFRASESVKNLINGMRGRYFSCLFIEAKAWNACVRLRIKSCDELLDKNTKKSLIAIFRNSW